MEHATSDPDPAVALLAEIARTHTRAGARFNTVAFALTPNFAVQPATVTAIVQQILPQNPARKSLIYRETQNVARGNTGVSMSGVILGPTSLQPLLTLGAQTQSYIQQMLQISYLQPFGGVAIDTPAPTTEISVVAVYGPPGTAGNAASALTGVLIEAF